jgi:hypothetical protein
MRQAMALLCALALFALAGPGVRADDYNKLTYFTFSTPVQVPGATLPAGKYMFKLADPSSGRRAIQIWDEEGKKLHTTLLTMSIQRTEIPKDPIVMFSEAPAGEAPAARSWFYEAERTGYEFVYPKDQAMKIARASSSPVLTTDESSADLSALNAAKVGRIDDAGQVADVTASTSQTTTADSSPSATTTTATSSSTTTATSSSTTTAPEPAATTTATAPEPSSATTTAAAAPEPSPATTSAPAAREPAPVARNDAATPVGTSGSLSAQQPSSAAAPAQPADSAAALPSTASSLPLFELLSTVLLLSALAVRELRKHLAEGR